VRTSRLRELNNPNLPRRHAPDARRRRRARAQPLRRRAPTPTTHFPTAPLDTAPLLQRCRSVRVGRAVYYAISSARSGASLLGTCETPLLSHGRSGRRACRMCGAFDQRRALKDERVKTWRSRDTTTEASLRTVLHGRGCGGAREVRALLGWTMTECVGPRAGYPGGRRLGEIAVAFRGPENGELARHGELARLTGAAYPLAS
jgi:hypothetical protein